MKLSKELKKVIVQIRSVGGYDLVQINVSLYSETKKKNLKLVVDNIK